MPTRARLAVLLLATAALHAQTRYTEATLDRQGSLHLRTSSGHSIAAPKLPRQVRFAEPHISADGRTAGWFATFHLTEQRYDHALTLVLYRNGRIVRTFDASQIFWDWHFVNGGRQVAYSIGPTHGGAGVCELHDVATGNRIAQWLVPQGNPPPSWAADLRR